MILQDFVEGGCFLELKSNASFLVSVWLTTYNHEKYVAEAIESVLMQRTNFAVELVIGEDCSVDKTREIVKAYKQQYPDIIRLFLPDKNLGMIQMTKATYGLCNGRYVAGLDGDDYWTDPCKLQKQVDFMESNPDYSICFHKVTYRDQADGTMVESNAPLYKNSDGSLTINHFLMADCPVYNVSVLFRRVIKQLPHWFDQLPLPDWGLHCLLLEYGKAKYIDENMSYYRIHPGGAYSGETEYINSQKTILFFKLLKQHVPGLSKKNIDETIAIYYLRLFSMDYRSLNPGAAIRHLLGMVSHDMNLVWQNGRSLIASLIRLGINMPGKFYRKSRGAALKSKTLSEK